MNKKILKLSVAFAIFLMCIGGIYAAYYYLTIPSSYTAVEYKLSSTPPEIPFGEIVVGESSQASVTLTNVGTKNFESLTMNHTLDGSQGTLIWDIEEPPLAIGASIVATFTLTLHETASLGLKSFNIEVGE